ncbi:uncharacterized protein CC84DRAFT_1164979 [Paraphaeosphaeria sporulosa]|uniref:Uncharacterized protein n=1 Tax=Paraphaeosphaeria sporulosa TaxID=1460663 RepID=A0A177C9W1_9PLEO|nr:uncharacterized protein CC84DRAFT_1164979 [Paraphaeosphaeria sporulosa]OAG04534.1 hypothetical protein CC84DRAFT_1164979 [Paraphaeosphaeria sporulosa]
MPLLSKPVNALVVLLSALGVVNAAPVPTPNEAVPVPNPKDIPEGVHYWPIDDAEADRLSKLLNIDFRSLNILGTFVKAPKATCEGCGKRSGLEDFVDNVSQPVMRSIWVSKAACRHSRPTFTLENGWSTCSRKVATTPVQRTISSAPTARPSLSVGI